MTEFRFANPNWAYALWLVVALVSLLFWLEWRRGDALSRCLSDVMQARLVHRLSRGRRWLSIIGLGLAGASLVIALMRPQWGLTYHATPRLGAQIMVCLDVSKSMLAEDTAPNRLDRAKAELIDLLSFLEGDQVGLIAFAGRAAVLCPLTSDFGFFKLILDGAGPHSVGRGGTRLEEPIRKALDGFRTESDVSRLLLLVTDGEDLDSHPLDAAEAAAEKGVTIVAIGFGDEAGSEIYVTDPETGAKTQVRDADGLPVISRLDGETLRDMALATEGAYVPAGTGALDLKSIYDAHIAQLVRAQLDNRGRAVRRDAFQWALLAGFVFFLASIVIGSGSVKSDLQSPPGAATRKNEPRNSPTKSDRGGKNAHAIAGVLLAAAFSSHTALAQAPRPDEPETAITADGVENSSAAESATRDAPPEPSPGDPRDIYNDSLTYLDTDFDRAERMLMEARQEAGTDGNVRFRATYNLGWVEVKRANELLANNPQEALERLRGAADWFRDAVRLRPDDTDARHNLEVVLRRVLELADSLAEHDERGLAQRLDQLIQEQRSLVGEARQVVDQLAAETDPNAVEQFRGAFSRLSARQRKILSDSQAVSNVAREELESLHNKGDEEQTPQNKVREAQLTDLLHYANRANQRLGQARSQMRRRQAERSFRRAAGGLTELKRARDQLRGPVEVLDVILADATSLAQLTSLKAVEDRGQLLLPDEAIRTSADDGNEQPADSPDDDTTSGGVRPLVWLTREYLDESQTSLAERTAELTTRLQAALEEEDAQPLSHGPPTADEQKVREAEDGFLEMVREAAPLLEEGQEHFQDARQSLAADKFDEAAGRQLSAIVALRAARERFLDLRGLIELTHARETEIERLLSPPESPVKPDVLAEESQQSPTGNERETAGITRAVAEFAARQQADNLDRIDRLAKLIEAEFAALPQTPSKAADSSPNPNDENSAQQQTEARRQQLTLARQLRDFARAEMSHAADSLNAPSAPPPEPPLDEPQAASPEEQGTSPGEALVHVQQAVAHLQALRRLFYSVVEHLRETAQRQTDLNDDTEQVAALKTGEELRDESGPLALRQNELLSITRQIGDALTEQSKQQPSGQDEQTIDPKQLEQMQQIAEQILQAAERVTEGGTEMQQAAEQLSMGPPGDDLDPATDTIADGSADSASNDTDGDAQKLQLPAPTDDQTFTLAEARKHQDAALQKLIEALALLQPPQQQRQQNEDQQNQGEGQQPEPQAGEQDDQEAGPDPSRLLQLIRDREAQRRREKEQRGILEQESVEKDW